MSTALDIHRDTALSLDKTITDQFESWEDWITYYLELGEASNSFSWYKADLLLALEEKFKGDSLEKFSEEVKEPRSTVVNYVRTARAFPPDKRSPRLSFTHHFQASYADSYSEIARDFKGNHRFDMLEKAEDENMSTRRLQETIKDRKEEEFVEVTNHFCVYCGERGEDVVKHLFYAPSGGKATAKVWLHPEHFEEIVGLIKQYDSKNN